MLYPDPIRSHTSRRETVAPPLETSRLGTCKARGRESDVTSDGGAPGGGAAAPPYDLTPRPDPVRSRPALPLATSLSRRRRRQRAAAPTLREEGRSMPHPRCLPSMSGSPISTRRFWGARLLWALALPKYCETPPELSTACSQTGDKYSAPLCGLAAYGALDGTTSSRPGGAPPEGDDRSHRRACVPTCSRPLPL